MAIGKISEKGQLVIPKKLRIKYGLKAKSQVEWIDTGQGLVLIPIPKDTIKSSRGMLRGTKITTETLLENRKRDKELERKKSDRVKR
ncbi:MAG TPA: AbrB/MazE/SpoVT family DNA-binding domain-containing protein [Thermodesulfobacteriota bacterium]|nr:AbrB/MazE/SpoVT family DNA-binding domain-containing protein [Thermodesulfobacteriota bacterium]